MPSMISKRNLCNMKQAWEIKKLGDICCKKQQIARAVKTYSPSDSIVYIDISAIDSSTNEITEPTTMLLKDAPSRAQQVVEKNDILVSLVRPNLKNIALICDDRNNLVASSGFCILRTKENPRFLKYIVLGEPFTNYLISRTSGANYPAVREDDVKGYSIPIPPLPEQEKIVAELDCLSGIIEKKKQQLKEYDALAQSIFYEMFGDIITNEKGWNSNTIGNIANFYNGVAHEGCISENGKYGVVNSKFISTNGQVRKYCESQMFPLYKNDIVMVMSDVPNGKALAKCYVVEENDTYTLNQRICAFRGYGLISTFLFYCLNRHPYYLSFDNGNSQTNLRRNDVLNCPIIIPPLALQQEFASKIEAIEKQKELIKQSIAETETLFNSRMDFYFN